MRVETENPIARALARIVSRESRIGRSMQSIGPDRTVDQTMRNMAMNGRNLKDDPPTIYDMRRVRIGKTRTKRGR